MAARVNGTLTRSDIADAIHQEVGVSRADAAGLVEQVIGLMSNALSAGESVKVSQFGTFILRDKGERLGRNPKNGIVVIIAPRRVLTFRASQTLRHQIVAPTQFRARIRLTSNG